MEELDERTADPIGVRRRVAVKPAIALMAAVGFAGVALMVIAGLTARASDARGHDATIRGAVRQLNALQAVPWRFEITGTATSGAAAARALRVSMLDGERAVLDSLRVLQSDAPVAGLRGVSAPLQQNFQTLNATVERVAGHQFDQARLLAPAAFRTHDTVLAALNRAGKSYQSQTSRAELDAMVGAVAAVVLLLAGFAFFYLRAYKAHAASEALADELRRSEAHLERAQRLARVGSWEWDPDAHVLSYSAEHARLHGWTGREPPRDPADVLELVSPDDRHRVANALASATRTGNPIEFEYRVREAYGGRLIHLQATSVTDANRRRRLIGTSQDVTDRFRRAEAERANRAKDKFISRMSHELRTPLNAVLGFGQLLTTSDLDERQHANVGHILTAGRHLLDLINEILDISRIETGDLRLLLEPVNVRSVIVDAIDLVTPIADPRGIAVCSELPDDDLWVRADVQRLRQVLLNLLSNAVKYNDEAGHVQVLASVRSDERVEIRVRDDGPGIALGMIDRLFSPFERLGAEQTSVEGTGLGLAVSRGMIEAMGGRITAGSEPGRGAEFTIALDRAAVVRASITPPGEARPSEAVQPVA